MSLRHAVWRGVGRVRLCGSVLLGNEKPAGVVRVLLVSGVIGGVI